MPKEKKLTLKEAREQGKLEEFIKEHEEDAPGDADRLEAAISRIVKHGKDELSKEKNQASTSRSKK